MDLNAPVLLSSVNIRNRRWLLRQISYFQTYARRGYLPYVPQIFCYNIGACLRKLLVILLDPTIIVATDDGDPSIRMIDKPSANNIEHFIVEWQCLVCIERFNRELPCVLL